jgi:hypothetical protein
MRILHSLEGIDSPYVRTITPYVDNNNWAQLVHTDARIYRNCTAIPTLVKSLWVRRKVTCTCNFMETKHCRVVITNTAACFHITETERH